LTPQAPPHVRPAVKLHLHNREKLEMLDLLVTTVHLDHQETLVLLESREREGPEENQ